MPLLLKLPQLAHCERERQTPEVYQRARWTGTAPVISYGCRDTTTSPSAKAKAGFWSGSSPTSVDSAAASRANLQALWQALALIRDAIEELAPVGAMRSSEAVMGAEGPEPHHEAEELIRGIQAIVADRCG